MGASNHCLEEELRYPKSPLGYLRVECVVWSIMCAQRNKLSDPFHDILLVRPLVSSLQCNGKHIPMCLMNFH